jgi:hypothetical protein
VVEDPAQGHLDHGHPFGEHAFEIVNQLNACLEWNAGKSLPNVESLAIAVVVVVRRKSGETESQP